MSSFEPNWVSPPGETILAVMTARGLTHATFSARMGQAVDDTNDLVAGRVPITIAISRRLADVLGGSVQFWMAREYQYRRDLNRLHVSSMDWLASLPVSDMARWGWIEPPKDSVDAFAECLHFFGVASVHDWQHRYSAVSKAVAFRTSPTYNSRSESVIAWIRQAEIEADRIECARWEPEHFSALLPQARALTRYKDPRHFLPRLRTLFSRAGVAVAVVRAPEGCRASGVAKFLTEQKALILLSGRHLSDDQFWFTVFHEAGHLVRHNQTEIFVDDVGHSPDSPAEIEANEFAASLLIPEPHRSELTTLRANYDQVIRFARRVGVSPGIVVGQLQHEGILRRNQLNKLKRRYRWTTDVSR